MQIITLLTDFGTEDGFVAAMKGRILSKNPEIKIIDVSHLISRYDVRDAAFCLNNYVEFYPRGTIHVSVIDPGVGSSRKPLIIQTDNFFLVTPDNGTASFIMENHPFQCHVINTDWIKWTISNTFHGRDIFAPAAAELASGKTINEIATIYNGDVHSFFTRAMQVQTNRWELEVLHIDHFGNIITNLKKDQLPDVQKIKNCRMKIGKIFLYGIKDNYSEVQKGECLLLWGSSGYLEIAQNRGNASAFFNLDGRKKLIFEY